MIEPVNNPRQNLHFWKPQLAPQPQCHSALGTLSENKDNSIWCWCCNTLLLWMGTVSLPLAKSDPWAERLKVREGRKRLNMEEGSSGLGALISWDVLPTLAPISPSSWDIVLPHPPPCDRGPSWPLTHVHTCSVCKAALPRVRFLKTSHPSYILIMGVVRYESESSNH